MKTLAALILLTALTGCAGQDTQVRTLFDRLEFDEDETGCFRLTGNLDLNPLPFISSNVNISLVKKKGEDVPDC